MVHDRDIKKAFADGFKSGDLKITRIEKDKEGNEIEVKEEDEPTICYICGKRIGNVLDSFAYVLFHDYKKDEVEEHGFCTRGCWNKFLINESKKDRGNDDTSRQIPIGEQKCLICGTPVKELREYCWLAINNINMTDVDNLIFCKKKCWKKYILREVEKIK